ncbi:U2 small nuclear ribonucleoprotein auxiliary factor 35 kDa subunit-related protein 2 [Pectinophora gossypiella]|uniref:U2 small nuclear ribonucleoprotein auxiliary factor 35 kDa subunit-related protein 2 n=1 Tax=Pectinophora gossypiella TaxID=13191 RepID=UPI00214E13B1|nr:U2 small nuclear ribonucleoprotein auxiliary factor 35 kDa subunit-related protein 2 [Pectinophora gossypiella]
MGRHKEWRKIAKRERRRKIRTQKAKIRDGTVDCNSSEYQEWVKEQEILEILALEQINKKNMEENEKWVNAETIAMQRWLRWQQKKERRRLQRLEEEAKLQLERELEEERKRKERERLKEIEEENKKKQENFMKHLEQFLSGDSEDAPVELTVIRETRPDCAVCPFFAKTSCCRFGDQCSRNHRYPGISTILLAANFFTHFGLENMHEYDTDIMLEYEDSDTYKQFKEFFYDVLPEFEKFGKIIQFKVCNNYEKHLRGNMFIEYAELRCAVAAYRALHTRWYGGKQLSLQFCFVDSWRNALCGLQSTKRCPKGRACNYLHVFRNPNNMFNTYYTEYQNTNRSRRTPTRSWRWSESPELEIPRRRRSKSKERRKRRSKSREQGRRRSKSRERRRRSESKEKGERHSTRSHSREVDRQLVGEKHKAEEMSKRKKTCRRRRKSSENRSRSSLTE